MSEPFVSVIIVNYNGRTYLEKCLKSLMNINYSNFQVILVDNNSEDGSVEFVRKLYPTITIKKLEKNFGFAKPNNIGARISKGNYLLFLNNDTDPDPNFVKELVDTIKKNSEIAICQSLLLKPDGSIDSGGDYVDKYGRAYSMHTAPNKIKPILSARGASMLIKKDVFWELGGFDENFVTSFEDVDIGWRAWIMGYKAVIVPKSIVYHFSGKTIEKLKKDIQFHGAKNSLVLRLVNFERWYSMKSITILFFTTLMRRLFGISVISDPEETKPLPPIKIMLKAISWVFRNWNYVSTKRKQLQTKRVRSTNELIKLNLIT